MCVIGSLICNQNDKLHVHYMCLLCLGAGIDEPLKAYFNLNSRIFGYLPDSH